MSKDFISNKKYSFNKPRRREKSRFIPGVGIITDLQIVARARFAQCYD